MVVPFTKLSTRKSLILTSKIDQLFSGLGININLEMENHEPQTI